MIFRPKRNRRRIDVAKKTGEVKAVATRHAPLVRSVLGTTVVAVGLVWGSYAGWQWACQSPRLALEQVAVRGTERAAPAQLLRLGGLTRGQNLLTLDVDASQKAMAAHPWVDQATVRRRLPHGVEVVVQEHQPVAVASLGELYLVNAAGEPFKRLQPGDELDLPLVTGLDRDAFLEHRDETLGRLREALGVLRAWQASAVGQVTTLSEVRLAADGVTVVAEGGLEVRLGQNPAGSALERLAVVKRELERRSFEAALVRMDDRVRPGRVTVQLAGGSERGSRSGN